MDEFSFEAIGTSWQIDTEGVIDATLRTRLLDRVEAFDRTYSRFRKDSIVAKMSAAAHGGSFVFPDEAEQLFDLYDMLYRASVGAVDPLVGRDMELLGYDRTYSLQVDTIGIARHSQERPSWMRDVDRSGADLRTARSLVLDVGAVGKGFLVDILSELLREDGHRSYVVDGSGDIRHAGPEPLVVGLEHPIDPNLVIGTARIANQALCASSTSRRAWGDGLHHILDARTGVPVRDVIATWVVAEDAAVADGLATALFVAEPTRLAARFDFQFVRMFADGRADVSAGFAGEIFTS